MNEFNVLLAAATNGTPSGSLFDALFARYIAPQESWRELESPLPITILAAGEDLIDYRIYGNTVQTGTPTPQNPIMPSGCGERTENLLDVSQIEKIGSLYQSGTYVLACDKNTTYTFSSSKMMQSIFVYGNSDYSSDRIAVAFSSTRVSFGTGERSTVYLRFDLNRTSDDYRTSELMITEGSAAPDQYVPYGYKLPMVVRSNNLVDEEMSRGYFTNANFDLSSSSTLYKYRSIKVRLTTGSYAVRFGKDVYMVREIIDGVYSEESFTTKMYAFTCTEDGYVGFSFRNSSNTNWNENPTTVEVVQIETVPIYIGSDPLAEDEYVDFGKQKIYRKVNGILTPTDPPVPIPAMPTVEGETIIDYNPSTTPAVEPEKMYIKYKPQ